MGQSYKITVKDAMYFVTSSIIEMLPVFTARVYFEIIIDSLKFCQDYKNLKLYAYVIMDNHFHLVVSALDLPATLASLRRFTATEILKQLKLDNKNWLLNQLAYYKKRHKVQSEHQVWDEGMHPEIIMSTEMFAQKVEYIHQNPVKRGLVDEQEHWRYSSARNYKLGDHSIIRIDEI